MSDDVSMEGKPRSSKRDRTEHLPDLREMFIAKDNTLPFPVEDDHVVFMKRDASAVRLGVMGETDNQLKKNPMYTKYLSGMTAKVEMVPSFKSVVRCREELMLVDRPLYVGSTVVRFENEHLGGAREKERWCKESQIGTVLNVKSSADVIVLPSKNVVVENIPLLEDNVEVIQHRDTHHNFLMYENSIGEVKDCVNEVTLRYRDSHTVIVRECSSDARADGVFLLRRDSGDDGKALVKGELVGMSEEDALGKFARWPNGIPFLLKRKKKGRRERIEHFTVEKVRIIALDVKWLATHDYQNQRPVKRIEGASMEKVRRFEPDVNIRYDLGDRVVIKTPEEAKAVSRRDYVNKLTAQYRDKFEKMDVLADGCNNPSSSGQSPSGDGVPVKAAKLSTGAAESTIEERKESEELKMGDSLSDDEVDRRKPSIRMHFARRRARSISEIGKLLDGSCAAKELLGDEFIGEVLRTRTVVDVEWLDGSVSREVPSWQLCPRDADIDQEHHVPGAVVGRKEAHAMEHLHSFGIIVSTNGDERCCRVRWFMRNMEEADMRWEEQEYVETLSQFDIIRHPNLQRGRLGNYAQLYESPGIISEKSMQVVENLANGKQKFRLLDGTFLEAWPDEVFWLPSVHDYADVDGSEVSDISDIEDGGLDLDLYMPGIDETKRDRNRRVQCFLHFMTVEIKDVGDTKVNRMRWFEAMLLLVRNPLKDFYHLLRRHSISLRDNPLFKDALDYAGFLHDYRHEAEKGKGSWSDWIVRKWAMTPKEGKPALRKYFYELNVLRMNHPSWFEFQIVKDITNKLLFAMWCYLDSRMKMRRELFGYRRSVTVRELEAALGEKVDEYYSAAAWKEMTSEEVLRMFSECVDPLPRDLLGSSDETKARELAVDDLLRPFFQGLGEETVQDVLCEALEIFVENGLLTEYLDISTQRDVNNWQTVYEGSGDLKDHYDEMVKKAPAALRLKVCGDASISMSDCFIWFHVLRQVLMDPSQLPNTIYIDPAMRFSLCPNGCYAICWLVLMQSGISPAPFYGGLPTNREEYYAALEKTVERNPHWDKCSLQLATVYHFLHETQQRESVICLNVFERFFPMKNIVAAVRFALSNSEAKQQPINLVMESEVKEYTSGRLRATAEQVEELRKWTGDAPLPPTVDTEKKEQRFEVLAECSRSHKFHSAALGGQVARAFYTAVRMEHRLLREHTPEGIFVHAYEDRTDLLSFLIIGPSGTPYEGVPFLFDVHLPDTYPDKPPQVHYVSYSAEQLNPNLYLCGKVCTSLLGTWSGEGIETWNAKTSNLLQVILSIQGLILVTEPYFNEAGYESRKELPESGPNSRRYNETAAVNALEYLWKIYGDSSVPFADVIRKHVQSIWVGLREKLLLFASDENSLPEYPVIGSKGFRLAIDKAVHRIDERVVSEAKKEVEMGETGSSQRIGNGADKEKEWPVQTVQNQDYNFAKRAEGAVHVLSGLEGDLLYEFTQPVTCFMLAKE